jgi:glucose-6-phosphate isomerase
MSVSTSVSQQIKYDPRGALISPGGITAEDWESIRRAILDAREEVVADAQLWADEVEPPAEKIPLDAGFHRLPERLLAELAGQGAQSEIERLRASADRLASRCDSVVVLGIGGSYMGARALLESCCHPFYNEVTKAQRGGRPRIYFEGNNVDTDAVRGLLDVLQNSPGRWGIVVISKSGGTLETAAVLRILLRALAESLGDGVPLGEFVIPITGEGSRLDKLAAQLGCAAEDVFRVPDGVGGRFSVLSAVGLYPAALMGLDLEQLLGGAVVMNEHFVQGDVGDNVVLDYTAVCHLLEQRQGCVTRLLSTWGKRLEAFGLWYDQLLAESLGKQERGALPLTVVNTRDLHSRGQQHQEGRRDKLVTNVMIQQDERQALAIGPSEHNADQLNELADKTLRNILEAAHAGTNKAYRDASRPTTDLWVPQLNENTLGQLFQMMMLATVLEGRLMGINPYGQPGVEDYKTNMNAILRQG